jgi:hypothetical protein
MARFDSRIAVELRRVLGDRGLIVEPEQLRTYECDGLTHLRVVPTAVLLPASTDEVRAVMRICRRVAAGERLRRPRRVTMLRSARR